MSATPEELADENRRLRRILATMAKVEAGTGGLVEVYVGTAKDKVFLGVSVCRADVDEQKFAESMREGLDALGAQVQEFARITKPVFDVLEGKKTGVTAEDKPSP